MDSVLCEYCAGFLFCVINANCAQYPVQCQLLSVLSRAKDYGNKGFYYCYYYYDDDVILKYIF